MTTGSSSEGTPVAKSIEDRPSPRISGLDRIRQRKAHSRSRKGCLVCRQRHKRCDENFVDGSCDRCRRSDFQCVLRPSEERLKYANLLAEKTSTSQTPSTGPFTQAAPTTAITDPPPDVTISSTDLSEFISSLFQPFDTNQQPDHNTAPSRVSMTDQSWLSGTLAKDMDLYAACLIGQLRFTATSKVDEKHSPVEELPSTISDEGNIDDIMEGCTWLRQRVRACRSSFSQEPALRSGRSKREQLTEC
ncbi:hypothetical protein I306_02655 [Cryptococcus gattii EJB2]|uniref:Zn(2)-C6 fungal-type domain-containing protein n=1 Tax=Cryptococcus gattii EJB2 TaxID=1296103 RepID=A0ABR5BXE1_9TREE|nr:hypothetical protein I306_02655 [Cryptococcus gattii EJB2]